MTIQAPIGLPPAPAVMAILNRFNRDELGNTIEVLVSLLDIWDGDPDAESGNDAEDDFTLSPNAIAFAEETPGCPVADPADPSFTEWHTRGRRKDNPGIHDARGYEAHEDAEDEDPAEAVGDEEDTNNAEDELLAGVPPGFGGRGAGCSLSDSDGDRSYAEWQTLPAATRRSGAIDGKPLNDWGQGVAEDAEDDDQDACLAADDDPARRVSDGLPGDSYDTEPNGDEGDYSR